VQIWAVINQKGGVGKTTTTANLGAGLARQGKRVLLIDLDPQANLSLHLDVDVHQEMASIYGVLRGEHPVGKALRTTRTENLDLVPSNIDLSGVEIELVNEVGREMILRDALLQDAAVRERRYDCVLVDCPPSLGLLAVNALTAADSVLIPVQSEFFALQGMGKLMQVVDLVRHRLNPRLTVAAIVICMYQGNTNLAREVVAEVKRFFGEKVMPAAIRQNIKLAEAPSHGQTIFEYAPGSNGALDYDQLAREFVERFAAPAATVSKEQAADAV
jgi:chromosome partitioning protein